MPESVDFALRKQIREAICPDGFAFRRIECNGLSVTHVVPIVEGDQKSAVGYKKIYGRNRVEQRSSCRESVRPIFFEPIKLSRGVGPLGRSAKSYSVAKTLSREHADE